MMSREPVAVLICSVSPLTEALEDPEVHLLFVSRLGTRPGAAGRAADAPGIHDPDLRSRALTTSEYESLVREKGAEVIDRAGEHELLRVQGAVFIHLKAAPSPRGYLLQVPPTTRTVRQAISWTFGR